MNKYLSILVFAILTSYSISQEAANKKIQAGLTIGAGLNFTNPTTKFISRNGVGTDLTVGMNFNYNYTPTIGFSSGIEFDFETIKLKTDSSLYYVYNDSEILTKSQYSDETDIFTSNTGKVYKIKERKLKPIYLTIPTMFLFRTEFIGYFRYFGKFGLRNSFLLGNTIFDTGGEVVGNPKNTPSPLKNENMKSSQRDLAFYKGAIGISGGTEWNFSGTTSLVFELGYYYGFLNISRGSALTGDEEKNMSVISGFNNNQPIKYTSLPAKQDQLLLKVSILF
jgi:hypothetical protein